MTVRIPLIFFYPFYKADSNEIYTAWKTLSSTKHAERQISRDLQAKLQLITVAVLFVYRFRNSRWSGRRDEEQQQHENGIAETASTTEEDTDFQILLNNVEIPQQERAADRHKMTSLLDILPDFKKLCAMLSSIFSSSEEGYMHLAARFMLQAVIEQHTIFENVSIDLIEEAFSWQSAAPDDDHKWATVRPSYLAILQPAGEESLGSSIARVAQQFPVFEFEVMITARLREILDGLETPMLVKLETGQLGDWDPSSFRLSNIRLVTGQLQQESSRGR